MRTINGGTKRTVPVALHQPLLQAAVMESVAARQSYRSPLTQAEVYLTAICLHWTCRRWTGCSINARLCSLLGVATLLLQRVPTDRAHAVCSRNLPVHPALHQHTR